MLLDEAAQVSDELYYAVTPMFAVSRGRLILLSTPHGKQGIFWHAWNQEPDWKRVKVTADQCPRISKEFLEQERRAMGEWWFAQEVLLRVMQPDTKPSLTKGGCSTTTPDQLPDMDTIIQSWDTTQTKARRQTMW